jgi:cyclophilin family peptidyl-prolyl cis-trans isomerase
VFGQVIKGMEAVDKIAAFAGDASLAAANGGGRNPGKKALIKRPRLDPLSKYEAAPAATPAAADTGHTHQH